LEANQFPATDGVKNRYALSLRHGDTLASTVKRHIPELGAGPELLFCGQVPELDCLTAIRREVPAVGTVLDTEHGIPVAAQGVDGLARGQIPDFDLPVPAAGGEVPAIRAESNPHRAATANSWRIKCEPGEAVKLLPRSHIPESHCLVKAISGQIPA